MFSRSSRGRPENVLGTSLIKNSEGRSLDVRLGRPLDVILRRHQDVSSAVPRDGQIGSLGYVLGRWRGTSSDCSGDQYLPAGLFLETPELLSFLSYSSYCFISLIICPLSSLFCSDFCCSPSLFSHVLISLPHISVLLFWLSFSSPSDAASSFNFLCTLSSVLYSSMTWFSICSSPLCMFLMSDCSSGSDAASRFSNFSIFLVSLFLLLYAPFFHLCPFCFSFPHVWFFHCFL